MNQAEINDILIDINANLQLIHTKINNLENMVEKLQKKMDSDVIVECKKMGSHINFIENVYDNVKHPLGYINNKVKYLIGKEEYSLTDGNNTIDNTNNNDNNDNIDK